MAKPQTHSPTFIKQVQKLLKEAEGGDVPFGAIADLPLPGDASINEQLIYNRANQIVHMHHHWHLGEVDEATLMAHCEFSRDDFKRWVSDYLAGQLYHCQHRWQMTYDATNGSQNYMAPVVKIDTDRVVPDDEVPAVVKDWLHKMAPATHSGSVPDFEHTATSLSRYVLDDENRTVYKELVWAE